MDYGRVQMGLSCCRVYRCGENRRSCGCDGLCYCGGWRCRKRWSDGCGNCGCLYNDGCHI